MHFQNCLWKGKAREKGDHKADFYGSAFRSLRTSLEVPLNGLLAGSTDVYGRAVAGFVSESTRLMYIPGLFFIHGIPHASIWTL